MTLVRPLARSPAAARAGQVAAAALLACTGLARAELPIEQLRTEPLAPATPERILMACEALK